MANIQNNKFITVLKPWKTSCFIYGFSEFEASKNDSTRFPQKNDDDSGQKLNDFPYPWLSLEEVFQMQ